jgi:hypothetical protein
VCKASLVLNYKSLDLLCKVYKSIKARYKPIYAFVRERVWINDNCYKTILI